MQGLDAARIGAWTLRASAAVLVLTAVGVAVWILLMASGNVRAPYAPIAKRLAWAGGFEEEGYNFGVVVPGRVYRSGRPDLRFLRALRQRYGVERIVSLNDANDFHDEARAHGFDVMVLDWSTNRIPPRAEVERVLDAMETGPPLLVHCSAGSDRSGYAIAAYRLERQGWPMRDAFEEMNAYWHKPYRKPWFQAALRGVYGGVDAGAVSRAAPDPPRPVPFAEGVGG